MRQVWRIVQETIRLQRNCCVATVPVGSLPCLVMEANANLAYYIRVKSLLDKISIYLIKTNSYSTIHDREFCPISLSAVLNAVRISWSLAPDLGGTITVRPERGL